MKVLKDSKYNEYWMPIFYLEYEFSIDAKSEGNRVVAGIIDHEASPTSKFDGNQWTYMHGFKLKEVTV
jgi:hypothetical protein